MLRRSALLALTAVLPHALAPLLAGAKPGAPAEYHELCTAQGIVTVPAEGGSGPPATPAEPDHCSICTFHNVVAMPAHAAPTLETCSTGVSPLAGRPLFAAVRVLVARPRAPPQIS